MTDFYAIIAITDTLEVTTTVLSCAMATIYGLWHIS